MFAEWFGRWGRTGTPAAGASPGQRPEPDPYSISPYGRQAGRQIGHLATLFRELVQDQPAMDRLLQMAGSHNEWHLAHDRFREIRRRYLATDEPALQVEYFFLETCLQTLYNETNPPDPFDSISPFFILSACIGLAQTTGVTMEQLAASLAER